MTKILVYSCVAGGYDNVTASLFSSECAPEADVRFVLYTNTSRPITVGTKSGLQWELRPFLWQHTSCNRRTARWHKINSHLLPDDADITVWIDGTQSAKRISIHANLVDPTLASNPTASLFTYKHPIRSCVYQELDACIKYNKDNPHLMHTQVAAYRSEGYPALNGMVETVCIVRKKTPEVAAFNAAWWQQLNQNSFRDQLSFNYTVWKTKFKYGILPGCGTNSPFFRYVKHTKNA